MLIPLSAFLLENVLILLIFTVTFSALVFGLVILQGCVW